MSMVGVGSQLSDALGESKIGVAWQLMFLSAAQVIVGLVTSCLVTVWLQGSETLPQASTASQVLVKLDSAGQSPAAPTIPPTWRMVTAEQLSEAVGSSKTTAAAQSIVLSAAQVIVGLVTSCLVTVWLQGSETLPQASTASQVLVKLDSAGQSPAAPTIPPTWRMVTAEQLSEAVGSSKTTAAAQSIVLSAAQVIVGLVTSCLVTVWLQGSETLPQASTASQVLVKLDSAGQSPAAPTIPPTWRMVTAEQLSEAVGSSKTTAAAQSIVLSAAQVIVGLVTSCLVTVWLQGSETLPQASTASQVLVKLDSAGQSPAAPTIPPTWRMVTAEQLSEAVGSSKTTAAAQSIVLSAAQVIVGLVTSCLVTVWLQGSETLPQASTASQVLVKLDSAGQSPAAPTIPPTWRMVTAEQLSEAVGSSKTTAAAQSIVLSAAQVIVGLVTSCLVTVWLQGSETLPQASTASQVLVKLDSAGQSPAAPTIPPTWRMVTAEQLSEAVGSSKTTAAAQSIVLSAAQVIVGLVTSCLVTVWLQGSETLPQASTASQVLVKLDSAGQSPAAPTIPPTWRMVTAEQLSEAVGSSKTTAAAQSIVLSAAQVIVGLVTSCLVTVWLQGSETLPQASTASQVLVKLDSAGQSPAAPTIPPTWRMVTAEQLSEAVGSSKTTAAAQSIVLSAAQVIVGLVTSCLVTVWLQGSETLPQASTASQVLVKLDSAGQSPAAPTMPPTWRMVTAEQLSEAVGSSKTTAAAQSIVLSAAQVIVGLVTSCLVTVWLQGSETLPQASTASQVLVKLDSAGQSPAAPTMPPTWRMVTAEQLSEAVGSSKTTAAAQSIVLSAAQVIVGLVTSCLVTVWLQGSETLPQASTASQVLVKLDSAGQSPAAPTMPPTWRMVTAEQLSEAVGSSKTTAAAQSIVLSAAQVIVGLVTSCLVTVWLQGSETLPQASTASQVLVKLDSAGQSPAAPTIPPTWRMVTAEQLSEAVGS